MIIFLSSSFVFFIACWGVTQCKISEDGLHLFSSSVDSNIKQWCIESGQCLHTFEGHYFDVISFVLCETNNILISGSFDRTIIFWDIITGMFAHHQVVFLFLFFFCWLTNCLLFYLSLCVKFLICEDLWGCFEKKKKETNVVHLLKFLC